MNNNYAYQYSCSSQDEPHTDIEHPAVFEDIAKRATTPLPKEPKVEHKYIYPEFDGYEGENLLKEIISAVLPLALARTWEKTMSFGGQTPWAGTERISQRAQITQRKIQQDLKDLQDLGLLEIKVGIETKAHNDQIINYRAEYKDFSKLYHLAHEYHEWRQSRSFMIYQPIFADCMRLREKHELYLKIQEDREFHKELQANNPDLLNEMIDAEWHYKYLLKFHNYRRLLTQKLKPGKGNKSLGEIRAHNGHYLHKTKNSDSLSSSYIETLNSNYRFDKDSNLTQEKISVEQDSPLTRRDCLAPPPEELDEGELDRSGKGQDSKDPACPTANTEQYDFQIKQPTPQAKRTREARETGRESAKEISAQQKGDRYISAVLNEEERKKQTPKQERRSRYMESKELRERCKPIANLYSHIAEQLNDQNEKSTTTLLCKMFEESGKTEEDFIACVDYARQKVLSIPQDKIRKRGIDGKPNRTPLFLQILKDALKRGIAACQEDDRRADEIRNMFKVVESQQPNYVSCHQGQGSGYNEQETEIDEEVFGAEILPSDRENELEIDQPQEPIEQNELTPAELPTINIITPEEWTQAKIAIKAATGKTILPNSGCKECGCKLGAVILGQREPYCVQCSEIPGWTEQMYRSVNEIIGQLYRHEIA